MEKLAHWYFAYGSNMQSATLRGRRRIEPLEARVGRLAGYGLCFDIPVGPGERGVANLCTNPDSTVWGVLFLLEPEQHSHLDRTEGVGAGLYRRVKVEVDASGQIVIAETYISEIRDPVRRPSHRYRSLLIEGAREHGLPVAYLAALEEWPLAWDERDGAVNQPAAPAASDPPEDGGTGD